MACGYDTDCICASAASILGIIRGAEKLLSEDGMSDTGLKIGIGTRRRDGSISDLARNVCVRGGETVCLPFSAKLCEDSHVLPQKNIFTAVMNDSSGARTERFGLAGGSDQATWWICEKPPYCRASQKR